MVKGQGHITRNSKVSECLSVTAVYRHLLDGATMRGVHGSRFLLSVYSSTHFYILPAVMGKI